MLAERAAARVQRFNAAAYGLPLPSVYSQFGQWFYVMNGEFIGPVSVDELKLKIDNPTFKPPLKMIWSAGMEHWTPVYECAELWADENVVPSNP